MCLGTTWHKFIELFNHVMRWFGVLITFKIIILDCKVNEQSTINDSNCIQMTDFSDRNVFMDIFCLPYLVNFWLKNIKLTYKWMVLFVWRRRKNLFNLMNDKIKKSEKNFWNWTKLMEGRWRFKQKRKLSEKKESERCAGPVRKNKKVNKCCVDFLRSMRTNRRHFLMVTPGHCGCLWQ